MTAEGEQPRLIPLHERLEGAVMSTPNESDEPLVALQPQKRRTPGERGQTG